MYQKSEWYFFGQCSIDRKGGVKVQKRHLVVEVKLKMLLFAYLTFSISALPPGDIFSLWLHLSHLWTLGQNSIIQIFDMSWLHKNIRQNVKNECFWVSCISGILKCQVPHKGILLFWRGDWAWSLEQIIITSTTKVIILT